MARPAKRSPFVFVGLFVGVALGGATLLVEQVSAISDNVLIGTLQKAVMVCIIPGLLGSAIVSGNVHVFSLWVAGSINVAFYIAWGWLAWRIFDK